MTRDREETDIDLFAEIRDAIREGCQLLAVTFLYEGESSGMSQDSAVARVSKISKAIAAWRSVGGLELSDALVCPKCDRVKQAGSSRYLAEVDAGLNLEGARLITCPECKAKKNESQDRSMV